MPKITKRTVDALVPAERERVVWDDDIKGFGVRVHPTGRKVYIVKYRHEGRSVKVTIGAHGPITPAAARAKAAEVVTLAKTGRDVAGKTPRAKGSATVADLAERFMEEYAPAHLKPGTARLYRKIIDNRILPRLGKRRVGDIGKSDVVALHHDMRDVPDHANRTLSVLSRMLTLAEVWEMRPEGVNPCRHVKKYPEHRRERFLSDEEYPVPKGRRDAAVAKAFSIGRLRQPDPVPDHDGVECRVPVIAFDRVAIDVGSPAIASLNPTLPIDLRRCAPMPDIGSVENRQLLRLCLSGRHIRRTPAGSQDCRSAAHVRCPERYPPFVFATAATTSGERQDKRRNQRSSQCRRHLHDRSSC